MCGRSRRVGPIFYVYLAGPVTGLSYGDSNQWREYVTEKFPAWIQPLNPMRGKCYLHGEQNIKDSYSDNPFGCAKGITCRDRFDVTSSDLLLVNLLGADRVSIGTVMEIAWADMLRKPIVLAMEGGSVHDHAMIREVAGFVVASLDEAIDVVVTIFS